MVSKKSAIQEKLHDDIRRVGGAHTKAGAGLLADHINAFWSGRAKAERYDLGDRLGWGVRSNLVGGLPPKPVPSYVRGTIKAGPAKSIVQRRAEAMHGA